jgi:hypothetical protein
MRVVADRPGDGGDDRVGAVDRLADRVRVAAVALDDGGERRRILEGLWTAGQGDDLVAAAPSLGKHVACGAAGGANDGDLHGASLVVAGRSLEPGRTGLRSWPLAPSRYYTC